MIETSDAGVTLVLASYNHERWLPDAIASAAAQDYPNLRIVITDDASTDASVTVIERELQRQGVAATTVFHDENAGICATFNEALALVETPFVAFIAADDYAEPDRLSRQVAALAAAPDAALTYSDLWIVQEDGSEPPQLMSQVWGDRWPAGRPNLYLELVKTCWITAPTVLARTAALRDVGGYDESLPYEDYDMWLRLAARGYDFVYLDEPLVFWRRVAGTLSDSLGAKPQLDRDVVDLHVLSKHLGATAEIDAWLVPFLFHLAVTCHKRGSRSPVVARVLRSCLRKDPSLASLRFAVLSTLAQRRADA